LAVHGIRTRLLVWFLLFAGLALAISALVTNRLLHEQLSNRVEVELNREAARFEAVAPAGDGLDASVTDFVESSTADADQFVFGAIEGSEPTISGDASVTVEGMGDDLEVWQDMGSSAFDEIDTAAGSYYTLVLPVTAGSERGVVVFGESVEEARNDVDSATRRLWIASGLALVGATVGAWGTSSRALRPLRRVTDTARRISETDLSARLPVSGRDELAHTAETFNEMLDRLEEAFESQRRLLHDVGHELKTPLTIIRGNIERLPSRVDPELSDLLLSEVDRMTRLVSDLRLLAQAEGPGFLHAGPVDTGDLTRDLFRLARGLAPRDWVLGPVAEEVVTADGQRVMQALLNLAQNAVNATTRSDTIEIGSTREDGCVSWYVRDSGPGVPEHLQTKIFNRFTRAGGSGSGTGLGLAIAKTVAEAHGGDVQLDSSGADGAVFSLSLPLAP
jgi:signal transduction histidine kinase